jgi:hypothetical protein
VETTLMREVVSLIEKEGAAGVEIRAVLAAK